MIEHDCLHQILQNQIFLKGWGWVVEKIQFKKGFKIGFLIWEVHIKTG
jgi:hypothetical protein